MLLLLVAFLFFVSSPPRLKKKRRDKVSNSFPFLSNSSILSSSAESSKLRPSDLHGTTLDLFLEAKPVLKNKQTKNMSRIIEISDSVCSTITKD